ncbi:MAG: hypothetical protein K9L70_12150 [Thiohalocapsa sp.]|nr:hypothetical protein [Thiohalocapsa sp.]MCF7990732.1 hypothetical protein [Thiohalocapsa sp.]
MISGQQALMQIVGAEHGEHNALDGIDDKLQELGRQLVALQQRRAEYFRQLARVRVDMVDEGRLTGGLDTAEHQVASVLEQRARAERTLEQELRHARAAREALDQERASRAERLELANARIDDAEAATQARLDAQSTYQARRDRAHEAERVAMHAEEKASESEREKEQKAAAYHADSLFMYLWKRGYGTARYNAGGLFRWLDGKVARLVGFEDARLNFSRLLEIPLRLREHADAEREAAEAAFAELRALDDAARDVDGIPTLERERDAHQDELDDMDARIAEAETRIEDLLAAKARYAAGEDEYSVKAIDYLAAEFERDDLAALKRAALATPFPEDDLIVDRLLDAEQEQRRLSFTTESLKQTRDKHRQKLEELARLQRDFKRRRMDRSGSSFSDGAMIAMLVSNFVNGMLDRDALMRVLEEQQRYQPRRADPTFGSGGFGRGTPWGGGNVFGSRGRGGLGGGFGGGGGGGGFRTGGGF